MESRERKALTFAGFDPDLAAAMVRIRSPAERRFGPGRRILDQAPEGRIDATLTEFAPAKIRYANPIGLYSIRRVRLATCLEERAKPALRKLKIFSNLRRPGRWRGRG